MLRTLWQLESHDSRWASVYDRNDHYHPPQPSWCVQTAIAAITYSATQYLVMIGSETLTPSSRTLRW